ncbi:MAG: MGMT family protein, partial [Anaerolineae bacterium]|nr:MGMT family protein [Anaerolineae bacterium]
ALVRRIPRGRVTTYGRIAQMLDNPRASRAVGYALHALTEGTNVPWQRVVGAGGRITNTGRRAALRQAKLLRAEGIKVSKDLRLDLDRYAWEGLTPLEVSRMQRGKRRIKVGRPTSHH